MAHVHLIGMLVSVFLIAAAEPRFAQEAQPADSAARVAEALRNRQYAAAAALAERLLDAAPPAQRELLMYERGLALLYSEKSEEAIAAFDAQLSAFPEGEWAHKAAFRKADALVALKRFEQAEAIYAQRVRALIGDARKARIAQVYIDFAQEYFAPPDKLTPPDYARARDFYQRALELEPGDALRDEILYRRALCNQKLSDHAEAAGQFAEYLLLFDARYRDTRKERLAGAPLPPAAGSGGKHVLEARFALAESQLALSQHAEARRTLQDLLRLPAMAEPQGDEQKALWRQAQLKLAASYQMPAPLNSDMLALGAEPLRRLLAEAPGSQEAVVAAAQLGKAYAHVGRYDEAIVAFRDLIERKQLRPADDETNKLAEQEAQAALFEVGRLLFLQKKYAEAIGAWNQYVARYPTGAQWSAAQQAIVDAEFQIGLDAVADKDFERAAQAWNVFLQKYPLDARAPDILYTLGELAYNEAVRRAIDGEAVDWREPIALWRRVVEKYPQSEQAGKALYMIGITLEHRVKDLPAAIDEYRKLTWSSYAPLAQQNIQRMQSAQLRLLTERVFRTDEPAHVRVDVRNVDKLTVKVYRIDLEDYFRKSQTIGGVQNLDLLLIDPDENLEVQVEGYERYNPITQEIPIPFDGPGACAVTVTSEGNSVTGENGGPLEKLESTTLVLRSDIDILVKSSRRQLLVFAQDMLTNTPAAGVRVLISDGTKIKLEGVTGEDGVWLARSEDLKTQDVLSVFARREGHVAGSMLGLTGLKFSTGLQPRGYIYTDRPAYKPGEAVNIRGILREVSSGQYVLPVQPTDEPLRWKLDLVDPKGRVLQTENLNFTDFGSFAMQFRIAPDAPVGEYKLIARRAEGPTFAGAFLVQTYQLPKAALTVEFDEPIVMRGDRLSGAIVAKYHYGEPVAGKTVEYALQLWAGEQIRRSGVTDKDGRLTFEFETTSLPEEGQVAIEARQAELDISTVAAAFVAVRAFKLSAKTDRPLYLSEEPVDVVVEATDLKGEPVGRPLTLTAMQRTERRGEWIETTVETVKFETDAKTGKGRATVSLTKGGTYLLRVEGDDRFGHVVSAETQVEISDADDQTRVRLFSDRQNYKVGDTIALDIHSRLGQEGRRTGDDDRSKSSSDAGGATKPAPLALLTYEGEEILGYRTVRLAPGHNRLDLPVENKLFPNFAVGVAVMEAPSGGLKVETLGLVDAVGARPGRVHTATRSFTVERDLKIAVKPSKQTYRPREEMEVELAVTDQQGRPVSAEVGLAMIDNALLTRFPDQTPDIVEFFNETAMRQAEFASAGSCVFRYEAPTRAMVDDVLAEGERRGEEYARGQRRRGIESLGAPVSGREWNEGAAEAGVLIFSGDPGVMGQHAQRVLRDQFTDAARLDPGQALNYLGGAGRGGGQSSQLFQTEDNEEDGVADHYIAFGDEGVVAAPYTQGPLSAQRRGRSRAEAPARDQAEVQAGFAALRQIDEFNKTYAGTEVISLGESFHAYGKFIQEAPPRTYFPEVAYWNPRIVTDADGTASLRIIVPDSSTEWKLVARGVTVETLCGSGEASVISRADFFVELLTPPALVEGDRWQPQARVHCLTPYTGKVDVTLRVHSPQGAGAAGEQRRAIDVEGTGVFDLAFDEIAIGAPAALELELAATTAAPVPDGEQALADRVTAEIPVRPWGMRREVHAAGIRSDSDFVELELPALEGGAYSGMRLEVSVGGSLQRWLIEEALEQGPRWEAIDDYLARHRMTPPRTHADTASNLLGCLYAADYVRAAAPAAGDSQPADLQQLEARIVALAAQLLAAQRDDGGWTWCGSDADSDPWTTGFVAWALGKANRDGYPVADEAISKLNAYLEKAFADTATTQTELKALTLHGIAWVGQSDYSHANRLYRNRESLCNPALAYLALTFVRLERDSMAADLLGVLANRMQEFRRGERVCRRLSNENASAWMDSETEITALALLAQLEVDARSTNVPPMVEFLAGAARAGGWHPHKAKGTVLAALATYFARAKVARENFELAVRVNGQELLQLDEQKPGTVRFVLPADGLVRGRQRVDFSFAGRGEYAYAVTLSGFSRDFPNPDQTRNNLFEARERKVLPPPLEFEGRVVPAGYSTVESARYKENEARHLTVGSVARVSVPMRRFQRGHRGAGDWDYLVAQEVIPAGFRLLTETLRGSQRAYDYTDNVLTLYFGSNDGVGGFSYELVATAPGTYRLPPTIVRNLYDPEVLHVNKADQVLTVLPRGADSPDEYRMSADELYHLGRMNFDDREFERAAALLKQFLAGDWVVREEPYREAVRMLLTAALRRDQPAEIVNYFEILKEKYPDLVIPFDDIVTVAAAYGRTDQHERAYVIYRATADASVAREASVGGALQEQGHFLDGVDFLTALWREYPDTPQVETIYYALTQTLYAQADAGLKPRRGTEDAPTRRVSRSEVLEETIFMLERFLALYAPSPVADEASYSLGNAYLDLDDFETVIARTEKFIELFPDSRWVDRFRYLQALSHFNLGHFDQARELAEVVANSTYRDEQGIVRPSPNKWLAIYIIGQIYHAQGQTAEAIEYYEQVKQQFSDAAEAIAYFEHKSVELPEVTIFHPDGDGFRESEEWTRHLHALRANGDTAPRRAAGRSAGGGTAEDGAVDGGRSGVRLVGQHPGDGTPRGGSWDEAPLYGVPFIKLEYRNIRSVVLQVYRVDLMKLALVEKDLNQITSVNLAGIRPLLEKTVELGQGVDYVDKAIRAELDGLRKQAEKNGADDGAASAATGAYLVICRADDDQFASGLVLVTPLAVEIQEDLVAQRVRVNVVDAITRAALKNVHVKVIGSQMQHFVDGQTDLRGVFLADAVAGYPTAIARDPSGHFAFQRTQGALLAMAAGNQPNWQERAPQQAEGAADYRGNLRADNTYLQDSNDVRLKSIMQSQQKGVQVKKAQ